MTTIAFVGLGNMGGPMATNLVKSGFAVRGFDVTDSAVTAAAEAGVTTCESPAQATEGADVLITMLPNGGLVKQVLDEIATAHGQYPPLVIDSSTIAVSEAREIAGDVESGGSAFLDAPVSGGVTGAGAGTLAFMVGGSAGAFETARPVFEAMGRSVTHCGDVGTGQAVKACNNMILAVQQIVLAEAIVMGERLGLEHQAFFDVVSNATGNSWSLSVNAPVPDVVPTSPANNDFTPGFSSALMLKDLKLAMGAAEVTGTDTTLGRIAAQQFEDFVDGGNGNLDFSAIIKKLRTG